MKRKHYNITKIKKPKEVVNEYFRNSSYEWKQASLEDNNRECVISGAVDNLEIHHVSKRFYDLMIEAHMNLNIKYQENLTKYSLVDLIVLKKEISRLHFEYGLGVCITHELHRKYHRKYGQDINSKTFHEFANKEREAK